MRSLYKISLAILAVGLLFAGSAFAQDKPTFTITGDAGTAFGQYNFDKSAQTATLGSAKAFSEWVTSWESNVRMTWATDSFTSIVRFRTRGSNEGSGTAAGTTTAASFQSGSASFSSANDVYGESWWTPGQFKLGIGKFQGQAWSQPLSGTYIIINPLEVAGGASEYWMNWTGIAGLDAEYNFGVVQAGVALSSQCKPSCNAAQSNATNANSFDNAQTIVPHLTGAVGDISFRAQVPMTSGTVNNNGTVATATGSTKAVSGSGFQAGVKWNGPAGLNVAADYGTFTDDKVDLSSVGLSNELKAHQRTSYNLLANIPAGPGFVAVAYFSIDDNNSANGRDAYGADAKLGTTANNTYTSTVATLRYNYPVSFGWIIPEYRATTLGGAMVADAGSSKEKDTSNSEFRVIMQGRF